MHRSARHLLVAMAAVATLAGPAAAQDMTTSDLSRLQQTSDQISTDLQQLRQRDRTAARALQAELADLDDEIIYLKVKQRKDGTVGRYEFTDLRDRLENLRSRVRGDANGSYSTGGRSDPAERYPNDRPANTADRSTDAVANPGTLPTGTELDVRLSSRLTSDTARVEDRFEATTLVDVRQNGRVVVPAGSVVRGVVTDVKKAGRVERKGSLTLTFDQIRINGRVYPIRGTMTEALEAGGYKEDAEKIGAGAAVGAVIGGLLGGVKGAITGILIGGGGVVAATEGENVDLPEGTVLRMRLDSPLAVRSNLTRQ
jgi:hypothetical protein